MWLVADPHPIGQFVIVSVRVVEKAAVLDHETSRVDAWSIAAVPANRPLACGALQRSDRLRNLLSLLGLGKLEMLDPAPAMATNIETGLTDGYGSGGIALESKGAAEYG